MVYNYNTGGLKLDMAGLMATKAKKDALDAERQAAEAEADRKRIAGLRDDQTKALTEHAYLLAQKDPEFDFSKSDIGTKLAGLDIDLWKKVDTGLDSIAEDRKQMLFDSSLENYLLLRQGRTDLATANMIERVDLLGSDKNANTRMSGQVLDLLMQGDEESVKQAQDLLEASVATGVATKYLDFTNPYEYNTYAPQVDEATGKVKVTAVNKLGDLAMRDTGMMGETKEQTRLRDLEANIEQTKGETRVKELEKWKIAKRTEIDTRMANSNDTLLQINEVFTAIENGAMGGYSGAVKQFLGQVLPGVDTSNEAALSSASIALAVKQLQNIKGPTTDFEMQRMEAIVGSPIQGIRAVESAATVLSRVQYFENLRAKYESDYLDRNEGSKVLNVETQYRDFLNNKQFEVNDVETGKKRRLSYIDLQKQAGKYGLTMEQMASIYGLGNAG